MQSTSTLFDYNLSGNITACHIFPYWAGCPTFQYRSLIGCDPSYEVVNYGYSNGAWGDLLTSYNGTTITYDAIGNPTNWRDGITNVTWNGRQLNSLVKGNYTYSYQYNADGIRTQKTKCYTGTSMAEITHYVLDGTKIVKEYRTTSANGTQTNVKYYFYDASGSVAGFEYNGNTYYFQKNIQGDIIRICDTDGNVVAEYTYDAWGGIVDIKDGSGNDVSGNASHIANINPFRYRGYYYDTETGFYYLQTRYYDPEVGRFLNADSLINGNESLIGFNLFAYCDNTPIRSVDYLGLFCEAIPSTTISEYDCMVFGGLLFACILSVTITYTPSTYTPSKTKSVDKSLINKKAIDKDADLDIANEKDIETSELKPKNNPVHHIVAQNDPRALEAQNILESNGINRFTDPANLIQLPEKYHQHLHTNEYFIHVNNVVRYYSTIGGKTGVYYALFFLKCELLCGARW